MKKTLLGIIITLSQLQVFAQTTDFDALAKMTNALLQSSINNSMSKSDTKFDEYMKKRKATRDLIEATINANRVLAGAINKPITLSNGDIYSSYSGGNLDNVTNITDYVTNSIKIQYFEATSQLNSHILNLYERKEHIPEITSTGNYILFAQKTGKGSKTSFRSLELEKYILPDEYYIPVCNISDNTITRQPLVLKIFSFLTDCEKCKNLYVDISNPYSQLTRISIDCNNKNAIPKNIDSALFYMRSFLRNPVIKSNVDVLDYATIRIWYNLLKVQNAKKTSDLLEIIETNKFYYTNTSDSNYKKIEADVLKYREGYTVKNRFYTTDTYTSNGHENDFYGVAKHIANYYFYQALLTYYEIKKKSGNLIVQIVSDDHSRQSRWDSFSNSFISDDTQTLIKKLLDEARN